MESKVQYIKGDSFSSNELLTGISILSVLRYVNELEISKCILVEPMLNHKELRIMLKKQNVIVRSLEEMMLKKVEAFINFNDRFQETLPLSINSIMLMSKLELLRVNGNMISFSGNDFDFQEKSLGKLMKERIAATEKLSKVLQTESTANLYLNLRVEL